jgi:type I restriction-modification system DNA methylase subunit
VKRAVLDKKQFLLMTDSAIKNHTAFIWAVADLLRCDYKQPEYGKVLFQPLLVRRLDCVLDIALTDIEFSVGTAPRTGEG